MVRLTAGGSCKRKAKMRSSMERELVQIYETVSYIHFNLRPISICFELWLTGCSVEAK